MADSKEPDLQRLLGIMRTLLGPDGCPWDREQTLETLRAYVIEEAYEVVDAIDKGEPTALCEELGDLLLQVVFQAELSHRAAHFGLVEVIDGICDKLERRHPHIFGPDAGGPRSDTSQQAIEGWERLKRAERKGRGALDGVPVALPALLRAVRVGEKASAVGYDWPDVGGARAKIDEELRELDEAIAAQEPRRVEHELGDMLFATASFARKAGLDPEAALRGTLDRFSVRFGWAEQEAVRRGTRLDDMSEAELDALWQLAKAL